MSKLGNKPKPLPQSGEQAPNQRQSQQPVPSQEKPPLNAANLQEQQNLIKAQRAVAMQRHPSGYGSRAPAAPTSEKPPPFPPSLGPQSPHGNPLHYGPPTLTADQLVLPQNKRRRSNNQQPSAGSTPVPANSTPVTKSSPLGPKQQNSSEVQKAPMPQLSFKCGASECQIGQKGFATQSELEQHNADIHEPEEMTFDDAAAFALESMRLSLGLDENGKIKPQQAGLEAPKMKPSSSAQSYTSMKREASSNLLKTPQASSSIKSAAMDGGKGKNMQGSATSQKETTPPPVDPWAGSCIRPEDIVSAFSPLAEMNGMSFSSLQKGLTPSSTISSGNEKSEKNSPRTSDISENDAVKISIDIKKDTDTWDPTEWFTDSLYNDIEGMNFGSPDPLLQDDEMDIFAGIEGSQLVDIGPPAGRGKKKDERDFVSEEWLKVYAPERLPVKKVK